MIAIRNVLVATDFEGASHAALRYGRELAERFDATLHVLNVVDTRGANALGVELYVPLPELEREAEMSAHRRMETFVKAGPDVRTVPVVIESTAPARTIVEYAFNHDIDLIVMGTHGRGPVGHFVMGSVAERVVRGAPCPVLTVKQAERDFVVPDRPPTVGVSVTEVRS